MSEYIDQIVFISDEKDNKRLIGDQKIKEEVLRGIRTQERLFQDLMDRTTSLLEQIEPNGDDVLELAEDLSVKESHYYDVYKCLKLRCDNVKDHFRRNKLTKTIKILDAWIERLISRT